MLPAVPASWFHECMMRTSPVNLARFAAQDMPSGVMGYAFEKGTHKAIRRG